MSDKTKLKKELEKIDKEILKLKKESQELRKELFFMDNKDLKW